MIRCYTGGSERPVPECHLAIILLIRRFGLTLGDLLLIGYRQLALVG